MCTELVVHIFTYFYSKSKDRNLADKYSSGALAFIFGHELGHALVDNLNLAVLGKEEDAVDAMSAVLLIETSETLQERLESAEGIVVAGAYLYDVAYDTPLYDVHAVRSMTDVRLANLVCWAGGGEPNILNDDTIAAFYNTMVSSGRDCRSEYNQQKESVVKLLSPYLKKPL